MSDARLLVINPGGTTTKVAYFVGDQKRHSATLEHPSSDLEFFSRALDQLKYRLMGVAGLMHEWGVDLSQVDAVVARGAPLGPLPAGTYKVDGQMAADIRQGRISADHPSLLGCLIARKLCGAMGLPAFVVDPVSVDQLRDEARLSGLNDLPRISLWHALNSRYTARLACERQGKTYEKCNLVVAHLGSGFSISAHHQGRAVDLNNANDMGPFAPQRTGGLPVTGLVKLCFEEGATLDGMLKRLTKAGGLIDHCGTSDMRELEGRMQDGDEAVARVLKAMAYQIAKEIGAMSVACGGAELIVLTGGLSHSAWLIDDIRSQLAELAPVEVVAGELEMEALAAGARRVLDGQEEALNYEGYSKRMREGECR